MSDLLLNKLINQHLNVDLCIRWLLQQTEQLEDTTCSRIEFITFFLNYIHEEIPRHTHSDNSFVKAQTPKRLETCPSKDKPHGKRRSLFTTPSSAGQSLEVSSENVHSTPQASVQNSSYFSPISPIYHQQGTMLQTPKGKRAQPSPLCLGDFIVKSDSKVRAKRINPTKLCQRKLNNSFVRSENSFNFQGDVEEIGAEKMGEQRSLLADERIKILTRKSSLDEVIAKKIKRLQMSSGVETEPDVTIVTYQTQIDILTKIYVTLLRHNLNLNITSELYFLITLLLNKKFVEYSKLLDDSETDVTPLNRSNDESNNQIYNSEMFENIHNIVYFAVKSLKELLCYLKFYDKSTLKLLANNRRLAIFSQDFSVELLRIAEEKTERIVQIETNQQNVCFNLDTDNRANFFNDMSFHAFKKQRDLFYEILRIWETNHTVSEWSFVECLGGKIAALFKINNSPDNFMHLARLFMGQLLGSCKQVQSKNEDLEDAIPPSFALHLDAEKLNKLKSRLVTKQSSNGINSLPCFTGYQEFYKELIVVASNHVFNQHLCNTFIAEILELNEFDESENEVDPSTRNSFLQTVKSLRLLAKFLGFTEALPYKTDVKRKYSENLLNTHIKLRSKVQPNLDLKSILLEALSFKKLILTIPWVVKYLAMLDEVSLRLPYYKDTLSLLFNLYKNLEEFNLMEESNRALVNFSLGWLFELPHFPDLEFFNFCCIKQSNFVETNSKKSGLDGTSLVDQNILYFCCPFMEEIKRLLSSEAACSTTIKHITPVTALQSSEDLTNKKLEQQLEDAFFTSQPISTRKTIEFVSERVASASVKHICYTVVPTYKKQVVTLLKTKLSSESLEEVSSQLKEISEEMFEELNSFCRNDIMALSRERIAAGLEALLSFDVLPQTKLVCTEIAFRMCESRVNYWINSHVPKTVFLKDLETELQKLADKSKEKPVFALPDDCLEKRHDEGTLSAFYLLANLQILCVDVVENKIIPPETVSGALASSLATFDNRCDVNGVIGSYICRLLLDFVVLLIASKVDLATEPTLTQFSEVFRRYPGSTEDLLKNILCPKTVMFLTQSPTSTTSWQRFAQFVIILIKAELLSIDNFESQCTGIFKSHWDAYILSNLTNFFTTFNQLFLDNGGEPNKFTLMLDFLGEFCDDL